MESILIPGLPKDAASRIAFTSSDLWPGEGWNFVFGQASIDDRVGVWSIYRNGDAEKEFQTVLLRTLKTALHETGHMFSLGHCTKYQCGMNGYGSRAEADSRPMAFCPECLAKVCFAGQIEVKEYCRRMVELCRKNKLEGEAQIYEKYLKELNKNIK